MVALRTQNQADYIIALEQHSRCVYFLESVRIAEAIVVTIESSFHTHSDTRHTRNGILVVENAIWVQRHDVLVHWLRTSISKFTGAVGFSMSKA